MNKKRLHQLTAITMAFLIVTAFLLPFGATGTLSANYAGKKIGILTGSIHDKIIKQDYPESELYYFSSVSDEVTALLSGTIDYFTCDILTANSIVTEQESLTYSGNRIVESIPTAFAFSKNEEGSALCAEMDEYLKKLQGNGTLQQLQDKWLIPNAGDYSVDLSGLNDSGRTLVFATSCTGKPNAYYYEGAPTGYELEIAVGFCREYGYGISIQVTDFAGIIPGLVSGKYQFAGDQISVTEERAESVYFPFPTLKARSL